MVPASYMADIANLCGLTGSNKVHATYLLFLVSITQPFLLTLCPPDGSVSLPMVHAYIIQLCFLLYARAFNKIFSCFTGAYMVHHDNTWPLSQISHIYNMSDLFIY